MDLHSLMYPRAGRRQRSSSWDRSGANDDNVRIEPGERHALLEIGGAGVVQHLWLTVNTKNPGYLRDLVLRMYWDGSDRPAVLCPLGDFFCLGHARAASVVSLPVTVVTGGRAGAMGMAAFNSWFAMPFSQGARIEVENQGPEPVTHFYYYVDFEGLDAPPDTPLRFHAHYRQERPTEAEVDLAGAEAGWQQVSSRANQDGKGNYVLLDTEGTGHYVGCVLSVDHLNPIRSGGWFGEGDDMFFIDGRPGLGAPPRPESREGANDAWPPTLHGTGTEDYFCAAWGYPAAVQHTPFHGVSLAGETEERALDYAGKWTMYRFHLADPVAFRRSLRVTIEHGHANCHGDDYSSVAFWYQTPRREPLPPLPPAAERRPRPDHESLRLYLRTRGAD